MLILSYHGVCESDPHPALQPFHCTRASFEKQIRWVAKNYDIVSLDQAAPYLRGEAKSKTKMALITVDDGLRSAKTQIAPVLSSLGVPFSLFVTTHCVGQSWLPVFAGRLALWYTRIATFNEYRLMDERDRLRAINEVIPKVKKGAIAERQKWLNQFHDLLPEEKWQELSRAYAQDRLLAWDEVAELSRSGVEIGSHGSRHALLGEHLPLSEIAFELKESRNALIATLGNCRSIAYPGGGPGDVSDAAIKLAGSIGYEFGFTTRFGLCGPQANPLALPRVCPPAEYERFLVWMKHQPWRLLNGYRRFRVYLEGRAK